MMKRDPGQTIFNDPEVAIWSGIGIGFCVAVAIIIADPKLWFLAFLAFFFFVPLIAVGLSNSSSGDSNARFTLFQHINGTYLTSYSTAHDSSSLFTFDEGFGDMDDGDLLSMDYSVDDDY